MRIAFIAAIALLDDPSWEALAADAPLRRHGLVEVHRAADTPLLAASPTAPEYPGCTITGPAIVRLTRPARAQPRGNTLHITPVQGTPLARGKTIRLRPGQRLKVAAR